MNSSGRFLVQSKDEWRKVLGRSPDKLDAVVMAIPSRSYASFSGAGDLNGPIPF
jgi:hypothetical protein